MHSLTSSNKIVSEIRNSNTQTIIALSILLLYFLGKTLYFALNIGFGISPDEITWFGKSLVFSKTFFLPKNSPESYEYGLVTHIPYLYFWLMGKAVNLNFLAVSDLVFLRCINVCIGLATVWLGWKTICLLTNSNITRLLFIVLCTNTLMLTFLSSFVSYDNLANFFAIASLYFLFTYFQNKSIFRILICALFVLAGCLTKNTFLPFAVLILAAFLIKEHNNFGEFLSKLKGCFLLTNFRQSLLMVACLCLLALNFDLYLGNAIKFGKLSASPAAVVGLENAMKNRIFARNHITQQFRENKLSLADARQMAASYIKHSGDRNSAFILLNITAQEKQQRSPHRIDRFRYAFPWMDLMLGKIFGIMSHKDMEKRGAALMPYMLIILLATALMIRNFKLSDLNGNAVILLIVLVGYALVLMQYVNYNTYNKTGAIVLALQGRYVFPVIYAAFALLAYYLTNFKSTRLNIIMAASVTALFMAGEFPWFLGRVTTDWYFAG